MSDKETTKEIIAECEGPFRRRYDPEDCNCREAMYQCDEGDYVTHDDAMERTKSLLRVVVELAHEKYTAESQVEKLVAFLEGFVSGHTDNLTLVLHKFIVAMLLEELGLAKSGGGE